MTSNLSPGSCSNMLFYFSPFPAIHTHSFNEFFMFFPWPSSCCSMIKILALTGEVIMMHLKLLRWKVFPKVKLFSSSFSLVNAAQLLNYISSWATLASSSRWSILVTVRRWHILQDKSWFLRRRLGLSFPVAWSLKLKVFTSNLVKLGSLQRGEIGSELFIHNTSCCC